ncbi:hypothetical protein P4V54_24825 [Brevibacillus nitrificans]|uniref:hypothetical protein n=1 Tax=Brevibacillus nitrificans TaxID=651560 RepID=UPI002E2201F6|nr:hypothetical protein [Brevibacillus nitrificans]
MNKIEKKLEIPINNSGLVDYFKNEFQTKNDLVVNHEYVDPFDVYRFSFVDKIKDTEAQINVDVYILDKGNLKQINKLVIDCPDETISSYDLEHYFFSKLYFPITINDYSDKKTRYTVRIYYYIEHDVGFKGEYVITWENKIKFKPLFNEKQKNTVAERIICFDVEVDASSLSQARSKAYNITRDFTSFLSVLIDTGFHVFDSKFCHYIRKSNGQLLGEFQRKSFFDSELKLYVMDNMNGLRHIEDYQAVELPAYLNMGYLNEKLESKSTMIINNDKLVNKHLEKTFLEHKVINPTVDMRKYYSEDIIESACYSFELKIPRNIRAFYKSLVELKEKESNKYEAFKNCCRLYNLSHTAGYRESTLMVSYLVSSVESLAKAEVEKLSFSAFMSRYLKEDYDKEMCDFLYGNIRSGHFHSGEFFFNEFALSLDVTFQNEYFKLLDKYTQARNILRKAIVAWIRVHILNSLELTKDE